ncbi:MAG TPA: DMT family transporter, partial [Egibacteraceae bacterium]|nr:DMT family transporter [Egibacteraceae bacterium]
MGVVSEHRRGLAALFGAVLIWSSTYVLIKGMLDDIGPFTLAVARFAVALAVLAPLAARRGFRWRMALERRWLAFGAAGVTLYFGLQNLGLVFTTAGSAALITASIPALTALVARLSLGERLRRRQAAGVTLSVVGVALVVRSGLELGDARTLAGNVLIL